MVWKNDELIKEIRYWQKKDNEILDEIDKLRSKMERSRQGKIGAMGGFEAWNTKLKWIVKESSNPAPTRYDRTTFHYDGKRIMHSPDNKGADEIHIETEGRGKFHIVFLEGTKEIKIVFGEDYKPREGKILHSSSWGKNTEDKK